MEGAALSVKSHKIKELFGNMEYSELKEENTEEAQNWLQTVYKNLYPPLETSHVLLNIMKNTKIASVFIPTVPNLKFSPAIEDLELTVLMNKLADAVEKNVDFMCQLEMVTRGFQAKDTKICVSLLVDSLRFYSGYIKRDVPVWIVLQDNCSLMLLGYVLGAAISNSNGVLFVTDIKISPIVTFIIHLAVKAGFPKEFFQISGREINNCEENRIIYYLGDKRNEQFSHTKNTKVISMSTGRVPMIIFNSGDLEAACNAVINAAWGHQGIVPWSVNRILVQEDVFEDFVKKLKHKLSTVQIGVDISAPVLLDGYQEKLKKYIADATKKGIEVYQSSATAAFSPTLFIGARVYGNNVIVEDDELPVITILAFRTSKEAVCLADNSRQGFAASVWTENIGLASEVARKLEVGTVWINTHGLFDVTIGFTTRKGGIGYLGGIAGCEQQKFKVYPELCSTQQSNDFKVSEITALKKGQVSWSKSTLLERASKLRKAAISLYENRVALNKKFVSSCEAELNMLITTLMNASTHKLNIGSTQSRGEFDIRSYQSPVGVVALTANPEYCINDIVDILLAGNSLLVLDTRQNALLSLFLNEFQTLFCDIVRCFNYSKETFEKLRDQVDMILLRHKAQDMIYKDLPPNFIGLHKNVWYNTNYSFA